MLKLVIGTKNTSSWSLRPWILMHHMGIPFEEEHVILRRDDTRAQCLAHSPSGKVPVLKDGDLVIWDSLAIMEYLAETFPDRALWPSEPEARARARSVSAEMHAGFMDLRRDMPMEVLSTLDPPHISDALARDIARVQEIWADALERSGGPFLFGDFTIADAMYAPVVTRFVTYGVKVDAAVRAYMDRILALPAMAEWIRDARAEKREREA